jgi:hypothetical protein
MTLTNWLTIVFFIASAVGAILLGQHRLITRLLADKWQANNDRHEAAETRMDEADAELRKLGLAVNTLETVCKLRHPENRGALQSSRT